MVEERHGKAMRTALLVQRLLRLGLVTSSVSWFRVQATLRVKRSPASTELQDVWGKNEGGILYCQLSINVFMKTTPMPAELHRLPISTISSRLAKQSTRLGNHQEDFVSCIPVGREKGVASIVENAHVIGGMYALDVPDRLMQQERPRLMNGQAEVIVAIPGATLTLDSVIVPDPNQVFVVPEESSHSLRRSQKRRALGRKPASKGILSVTTLRVSTLDSEPDFTAAALYQLLYEGDPSFHEQYIRCSSGQLVMEPSAYAVMDVKVNHTLATMPSIAALVNEAIRVANGMIEASNGILANTDLLMIVLPPGTGDWAAYATINGKQVCLDNMFLLLMLVCFCCISMNRLINLWCFCYSSRTIKSIYNNNWAAYLGGPMHEVGHNLGLRHAFENGTEYEDRTGYMGSMPNMTRYPEQCKSPFDTLFVCSRIVIMAVC
jgi:Gametolysin peptidase M11